MKFDWKLQPLHRKLEWDLELARGRLAVLVRGHADAGEAVQSLEVERTAQADVALAALRRGTDAGSHAPAMAWLAAAEDDLTRLRTRLSVASESLDAARDDCRRCQQRLEALATLHQEARARFDHAERSRALREADLAWLAWQPGKELA